MAKKNISITHPKVLKAYEDATKEGRGSRLIEDAILYYLDGIENEYITKSEVQSLIVDCLKNVSITGPISNKNYTDTIEQLNDDISDVLDL